MAIFLVSPTDNGIALQAKAHELFGEHSVMPIGNGSFLVEAKDLLTGDLKVRLGLAKDGVGRGIVFLIRNFSGFANKDIWEWLDGKEL